jgi:hypothetical protein
MGKKVANKTVPRPVIGSPSANGNKTAVALGTLEAFKGTNVYERAKELARRKFNIDLDEYKIEKRIQLLEASNREVGAVAKVKLLEYFDNIEGSVTKQYPHIAPTKIEANVSHTVPGEIAGVSIEVLQKLAGLSVEQLEELENDEG